jgi:hypothetical protein
MCRVVAKFVHKLLSQEQQQLCLEVAQDMLECSNGYPEFLKIVIIGDEMWVYGYDLETKVQSSQWKHSLSPRPKKAKQVQSKVKVLVTVFFDYRGIVHHSYAPEGQTVNKEYYLEVIRRLRDAVWCKRPDLWASRTWQMHHDNAAPYSPDMAPCDFWLFPKLKKPLKGSRFDSREDSCGT